MQGLASPWASQTWPDPWATFFSSFSNRENPERDFSGEAKQILRSKLESAVALYTNGVMFKPVMFKPSFTPA